MNAVERKGNRRSRDGGRSICLCEILPGWVVQGHEPNSAATEAEFARVATFRYDGSLDSKIMFHVLDLSI